MGTNKKIQVSSDMFTRPRTLLTKLLATNDHGQPFVHQVNDPLLFRSQILQQQQVRGASKDVAPNKSLFHFHPAGVMDPDVAKVDAALKKAVAAAKSRGFDPEVELSPQQYAAHMRRWIDGYFKKLAKHPTYLAAVEGCKHEELVIPVEEGDGGQVRVLVHTPAHLADREKNAGLVYAHGGAVLSGSAHLYKPHLSLLAINCGIPVFNVDYRLAPESKCPQQAIDFSSVLTHLSSNACSFGLDSQRLAAAGESGGGYVCMSALLHLAMRGQTGLVKLALPIVPMLSDYFLTTSPLSMTEEERFNVAGMRASWKAIAQEKPNVYELKFHQICSSVFHRTLRPSGTPLYFSPTRPQKNCWPNSLQPLSSPLSLTCSSQRPNALWGNFEEPGHWRTTVACQVLDTATSLTLLLLAIIDSINISSLPLKNISWNKNIYK